MSGSMLQVSLVQHPIVWEDKASTHAVVEALLQPPPPAGSLLVLPELFDTGFSMHLDAIVDERTVPWARTIARQYDVSVLCGHAIRGEDGYGRNLATLLGQDGTVLGSYGKVHPFSVGREAETYRGGHCVMLRRMQGAVVCPLICYDLRFPELWRLAALRGAEVFLLIANWPAVRQAHWRALAIARAIENQAYVAAVNRVGSDPKIEYAGGSLVIAPQGDVIAEAGPVAERLDVSLDLTAVRSWRQRFPVLKDAHPDLAATIEVDVDDRP